MFRVLSKIVCPFCLLALAGAAWGVPVTLIGVGVNNGDFEAAAPTGFPNYQTGTVASWTYAGGNSGYTNNSQGDFQSNGSTGNYGFVQGGASSLSQTFNLASAASLALSYTYGGRTLGGSFGGDTTFNALLDGNLINSVITTSNQAFSPTSVFLSNVSSGTHTLTFLAIPQPGDNTAVFDNVTLIADDPAPELNSKSALPALSLLLAGMLLVSSKRPRSLVV